MCYTTPGLSENIRGVILHWETLFQKDAAGNEMVDLIRNGGMLAGIKLDKAYDKKACGGLQQVHLATQKRLAVVLMICNSELHNVTRKVHALQSGATFCSWIPQRDFQVIWQSMTQPMCWRDMLPSVSP